MDNWSGQNIKGYELKERIGSGGFGAVYKAYQSTVGREVAMKIILPHFASHPDFIRRFETEAQIIARLEHLHITPLYDYWRDSDGAYLVMRWLRGGSLRDALDGEPYPLESVIRVVDQIASALAIAHTNGVIHRDLKPGNILLDEDGNAYLADFGIAKDLNLKQGGTEVDAIIGSPDYLSPEQARSETVTPQTDVYSFGVVLYEMLTGHHPFPNLSVVERLYKHLNDPLPLIDQFEPQIRDGINEVIQKATAKNPSHRYVDSLALADAFRQASALIVHGTSGSVVEILTQREHEILAFIIEGRSNKEIAEKLYVTVATVKWYITQIYRKLGVRSRVQAIVRARELNLIIPSKASDGSPTISVIATDQFQPINPYKGLRAFQAADAHDFFGREVLVEKLVKRLAEVGDSSRFLAVIGPSGSGKSSLVKAGLIPALWRGALPGSEKWFVVEVLPGARPLDELEVALTRIAPNQTSGLQEQLKRDRFGLLRAASLILPDDGSELILVIDQFEEVFTAVGDEQVRVHFLNLLQTAVSETRSRVRVIVTLRADFYDRPLQYPEFGELVRSRMETILPLNVNGLERAIVKPAEQLGVHFEEGLVTTIVSEMNYQTGALPLLQYALMELFDRRRGRLLTHAAYQEIGGAVGALAKRAEQIYTDLNPEGQEAVRQMFMRLVTLGEGVEDTRRRANRSELLALTSNTDLIDEIIDTFADYRLLALDHDPSSRTPTVEVAHEAILREWERLHGWLSDSREDIRVQRQLAALAGEWKEAHQDASFLTHGTRLETFEKWANETTLALTAAERNYLNASVTERAQQTEAETIRQVRETRLQRRSQTFLRGLVVVLLLATLGAFGLTGVAVSATRRAEAQSRIAQARELIGYATGSASGDADLSMLLALQAVKTTYTADNTVLLEANTLLHQKVEASQAPLLHIDGAAFSANTTVPLGWNKDGSLLVFPLHYYVNTAERGKPSLIAIADAFSGQILYTIPGVLANSTPFMSNRVAALTYHENDVEFNFWDISSRQQAQQLASVTLPVSPNHLTQFDVSLDFRYVITGESDHPYQLWDTTQGAVLNVPALEKPCPAVVSPMFGPDSKRLAVCSMSGINVIDTTTRLELYSLPVTSVFAFSPDGALFFTANTDHSITAWDATTGTEDYSLVPGIPTNYIRLSMDSNRLVIGSQSGQVQVWDTRSKQNIFSLNVSDNLDIAINEDGTRLVTAHQLGYIQIWDLIPGREFLNMITAPANAQGVPAGLAYSPDGKRLITGITNSTPIVWDALTGQKLLTLVGHAGSIVSAAWTPDGAHIATGDDTGTVKIWDSTTGQELLSLPEVTGDIYDLAFSPDGTRLASSSEDSTLRISDATTGSVLWQLKQPAASKGVAWSPDGLRIAAGTMVEADSVGHVRVFDAQSGKIYLDIPVDKAGMAQIHFSPDGTHILAGSYGVNGAYVLDAKTGEILMTLPAHTQEAPGVSFSPDGTRIATAEGGTDGPISLWDASTGQELLTLYGPDSAERAVFSPDGKYLASLWRDGIVRISVLGINDSIALAESRLTRWWTAEECHKYLHTDTCPPDKRPPSSITASITPDQSLPADSTGIPDALTTTTESQTQSKGLIVMESRYGGQADSDSEIFTFNPDGSNLVRLTNNHVYDGEPYWSPDGTNIAFTSNRDGNNEIYVMNADGSDQTRLTNNQVNDEIFGWSPDSTRIAFQSERDGNSEIYVMNADGSDQTRLTNNRAFDGFPSWSSDGKRIAFSSTRDGNYQIYMMNPDGSGVVRLTQTKSNNIFPVWSPDGKKVVFESDPSDNIGGTGDIYVMNSDGSDMTNLTGSSQAVNGKPIWSPDGTHILYDSNRDGWGLYIMNADGSKSVRITDSLLGGGMATWKP